MSAISKCGAGAALVAGACVSLFSGGPSHVLACNPTPVPRVGDQPGIAVNIEDSQLGKAPYPDAKPANYVEGIGATCDPVPAGYTLVPGVLADGTGTTYDATFVAAQHVGGGMLGVVYPYYKKD